MTLFDVDRLFSYWADQPPTHELVAMYLRGMGWKPASEKTGPKQPAKKVRETERVNTPEALAEFLPFFSVG